MQVAVQRRLSAPSFPAAGRRRTRAAGGALLKLDTGRSFESPPVEARPNRQGGKHRPGGAKAPNRTSKTTCLAAWALVVVVSINVNGYLASELSPGVLARDTRPSTGHEKGMVD